MSNHIILGAGGVIADGLAAELIRNKESVKLVSRHATPLQGAEAIAADITDRQQTLAAITPSSIVYLCIGLKYDFSVWREQWPKIMNNTIEACARSGAKLIFFDNVYMYGRTEGAMTEETPYNPSSRKGDLRARLATQLMSEVRKGNIVASIARSADFYGPGSAKSGLPNILLFANLHKGKKAQWPVNTSVQHSFTYTEDAAKALYVLAKDKDSWNQAWHLPTAANPPTGAGLIEMAATALGVPARTMVLKKWMFGIGGLFDKTTAELREMLYQYEFEYLFDSSKFEKAYNYRPASYTDGITATAGTYKQDMDASKGK